MSMFPYSLCILEMKMKSISQQFDCTKPVGCLYSVNSIQVKTTILHISKEIAYVRECL